VPRTDMRVIKHRAPLVTPPYPLRMDSSRSVLAALKGRRDDRRVKRSRAASLDSRKAERSHGAWIQSLD
jgi:hypothetical protein